jgi:thioredoxin-dependent peroxiredoxin
MGGNAGNGGPGNGGGGGNFGGRNNRRRGGRGGRPGNMGGGGGNRPYNNRPPQENPDAMLYKPVRQVPERTGVIEIAGRPATVLGRDVQVGTNAPEFVVNANDWSAVDYLTATAGKVRVLLALPSLDTNVCDMETRKFNEAAAGLSEDIEIAVISTDMPMTQKRWCGNAGVERVKTYSDVLNTDFGIAYGVLIKERRYLRRAVFIVDRTDRLTYVAYMPRLGDEPNYEEVLRAAQAALN